jgi:hypothetical protein
MNKDTFTKLMAPKTVTEYLKEAKKVGYIIEKDDMSFKVLDDETNDLVFKGIRMNRTFYAVTFNKSYWVEPAGGDYSAQQLEGVR